MPRYTSDLIEKLELGDDDQALVDVNLFKEDAITFNAVPTKSNVNGGQKATAKKHVTVTLELHDLDAAVKALLEGFEANYTGVYIKATLLDSAKSFTTKPKIVNVEEHFNSTGELISYTVTQEYDVDRSQAVYEDETVFTDAV